LFSVIGTTYGAGDGTTTFNVPNMKGRFPVSKTGVSEDEFENAGDTGGAKTHQLTVGELAAHTHSYMAAALVAPTTLYYQPGASVENIPNYYPYLDDTGSTGGDDAHNTLPPYIVLPIAQIKT
jgi:microcystin-dependent protein